MRNYELIVLSDITSSTKKVLVKNDKIKKLFDLDTIELEEFIDSKNGKHIKKYSQVLSNGTYFKIDKPYEELKSIIQNRSIPILGFAYKSKRYK